MDDPLVPKACHAVASCGVCSLRSGQGRVTLLLRWTCNGTTLASVRSSASLGGTGGDHHQSLFVVCARQFTAKRNGSPQAAPCALCVAHCASWNQTAVTPGLARQQPASSQPVAIGVPNISPGYLPPWLSALRDRTMRICSKKDSFARRTCVSLSSFRPLPSAPDSTHQSLSQSFPRLLLVAMPSNSSTSN